MKKKKRSNLIGYYSLIILYGLMYLRQKTNKLIFFFLLSLVAFFLFFIPLATEASTNQQVDSQEELTIYFFDDRLCSVCAQAKEYVKEIEEAQTNINLEIYSISDTAKLKEIAQIHGVKDYKLMAPTIFIGQNFFQFRDFTSRQKEMVDRAIAGEEVEGDCCLVTIPLLNIEVDIGGWSLLFIAIVLGLIDGFNVCSVGALILILSIVLTFDSKKKIFFFGGLFILTSVIIYGLLVFVWGKLFEVLVGQLEILRIIVGLAALAGGVYFLKEFWRFFKYGPTCQASKSPLINKATQKLKKVFNKPGQKLSILILAIISFAAIVTLVELPCSVGVPIAFSTILIEAGVSMSEYISYIIVFLLFYMLDELIILGGAVLTKRIWFAGSKMITWVSFIGAVILFYLAFYYLFS